MPSNSIAYSRRWNEKNSQYRRDYIRRWNRINKDKVYAAYGGYRCSCKGCDVTEPMFLTLDHVKGNGNEQRRTVGLGGGRLYRWIITHGFPKKMFRVLCQNCNSGRYRNGGICPHLRKTLDKKDTRPVIWKRVKKMTEGVGPMIDAHNT